MLHYTVSLSNQRKGQGSRTKTKFVFRQNKQGGKKLSRTFVRTKDQKINGEGLLTTHRAEVEAAVEEAVGQERHGRDSVDDGKDVVELEGHVAKGGRGTRACATAPGGCGYVSLRVLNGCPIKRSGPRVRSSS